MGDHRIRVINEVYPSYLLSILRGKNTPLNVFRDTMKELGRVLAIEIMNNSEYSIEQVETPLGVAEYKNPKHYEDIVLVGILRAALPLVEGMIDVYKKARVGFIGAKRVEDSSREGREFDVVMNYYNIPPIDKGSLVIIADPMLATASTMIRVLNLLKPKISEETEVIVASVIAAEYGLERLMTRHPYIKLYTVAIDSILNDKGYIVPGLGDAGDRSFG
ncbi:MAG: uracil phosphoribosyltransferase [Desulfurococcales archaeon]|nr:uracil phosphoribosyltransferase [Desulfurococcales archaeon]